MEPYSYQYGGSRRSKRTGPTEKQLLATQGEAITEAQATLDAYSPEEEWGKVDKSNLYVYDNTPKVTMSGLHETTQPNKLEFSTEQMESLLPALQDAQTEHGVLLISEFDKEEVQRRLDEAKAGTGTLGAEADQITPYYGLYETSIVYGADPGYEAWQAEKQAYDNYQALDQWEKADYKRAHNYTAPADPGSQYTTTDAFGESEVSGSKYSIDEAATTARYIEQLEEILADPNKSYASYWTKSKSEYADAYGDLAAQLRAAASESELDYLSSAENAVIEQQGLLDSTTLQRETDAATAEADAAAATEAYRSLFNLR